MTLCRPSTGTRLPKKKQTKPLESDAIATRMQMAHWCRALVDVLQRPVQFLKLWVFFLQHIDPPVKQKLQGLALQETPPLKSCPAKAGCSISVEVNPA